jgi:putative DNA primase/helicase
MFDAIFSPMGVTTDHQFVYYVRATKSVRSLSAHQHNTRMNLLAMAREDQWWATINKLPANRRSRVVGVRKVGKGRTEQFIDWCSLAAEMMDVCRKIGRFDPSKVRGRGLWRRSTGELVYNTGAQLFIINPDEMHTLDLADLKVTDTDPHRYVAHPSQLATPSKDEATPDESRRILDLLNRMPWENGECGPIMMGWIACATVLNLPISAHTWQSRQYSALGNRKVSFGSFNSPWGRATASSSKQTSQQNLAFDKRSDQMLF